jgi:hypothetical protein
MWMIGFASRDAALVTVNRSRFLGRVPELADHAATFSTNANHASRGVLWTVAR